MTSHFRLWILALENKPPSVTISFIISVTKTWTDLTNLCESKNARTRRSKEPGGWSEASSDEVLRSLLAYSTAQILDDRKYIQLETKRALPLTVHIHRSYHKCIDDARHQADKKKNQREEWLCINMWAVTFCGWYLHISDLLLRVNESCGAPNVSGTRHGTIAAGGKGETLVTWKVCVGRDDS